MHTLSYHIGMSVCIIEEGRILPRVSWNPDTEEESEPAS